MARYDPGEETGFSNFLLMLAMETFKAGEYSPAASWVAQEVPLLSPRQADQARKELFF